MDRTDMRRQERGNALIYVLIAIALFAALSFTLGRQTDTSEVGSLSDEKAQLYATQLISYATQAKSAVDQMLFTASTSIDQLDFTAPTDATFETAPLIHKIYHPQGGGLVPGRLPEPAIVQVTSDPEPGWYLTRPGNIEWTASTNDEVVLVAYQISETVCGLINEKINGASTIPSMTSSVRNTLIDDALHGGTNVELTTDSGDICPECANIGSLCMEEGGIYAFYTIIADQ
ncbi:MAG: hypothetical protein AAF204_03585 [Pseudomonadota bacterium]